MTIKEIEDAVKAYCEHELWTVEHLGYNAHQAFTRSYGAVMFVINLKDFEESSLGDWWDNEMHPQFRELC